MGYRQNNVSNVGDIGEQVWNNLVNTHSGKFVCCMAT